MTDDNIEEIIAHKDLSNYIRGEKQYSNVRPEVDYRRWRYIADYLASNGNPSVKSQIINTLLELLEGKNWQDLYAVAGICQSIDSPDVDKKVEQLILDAKLFSMPDTVVSLVSKYVMKKRLSSVTKLVVENAVRKQHVDWVVTLVSTSPDEQAVYWSYCDRIIDDVLQKMNDKEKAPVLEKVSFWKDRIMAIIHQMNEER